MTIPGAVIASPDGTVRDAGTLAALSASDGARHRTMPDVGPTSARADDAVSAPDGWQAPGQTHLAVLEVASAAACEADALALAGEHQPASRLRSMARDLVALASLHLASADRCDTAGQPLDVTRIAGRAMRAAAALHEYFRATACSDDNGVVAKLEAVAQCCRSHGDCRRCPPGEACAFAAWH